MILLPHDEAGVVLVDVELAVETEVLRVRAEEALDVRLRGQDVELLVLERTEVLPANLRPLLDLGKVEALAQARLAEAVTNFEHGEPVETDGKCGRERQAEGERRDHDGRRRAARSPFSELQPLEILLRSP